MLEGASPLIPCSIASQNHSLSLLSTEAHLSLSRFEGIIVFLLLCGSHSLVALALGKPITMLKSNFMHFHFFTKKPSFSGNLATHT